MDKSIDKIDSHLLYELDWNARQSETELAKKIRRSRESVRYRMHQLERKKIINGYYTWINFAKLGYQAYKIYLKIGGKESEIKEFLDAMRKRTDVFWLGIGNGAWDVGLTFFAKTPEEFFERKNDIFPKYSHIILQKSMGMIVEGYMYPETSLHPEEKDFVVMFGRLEENSLDDIDRKILASLFHDARVKIVQIASECDVSVDIVRNRMRILKEKGIIFCHKANIDYHKLGMELYKVFLYFDSFSKADKKKLFEIAKSEPSIHRVLIVIAPWDLELEIMVENYQEFNRIMHMLKVQFPDLRNIESATLAEDSIFPAEDTVMGL